MAQYEILPDDDSEFEITVTENDEVTPIPLGSLAGFTVAFCSDYGDRVHSTDPSGEEKAIDIVDASAGIFSVVLDRLFTKKFAGKTFSCDITLKFDESGNSAFPNEERYRSIYYKDYIKIKDQC